FAAAWARRLLPHSRGCGSQSSRPSQQSLRMTAGNRDDLAFDSLRTSCYSGFLAVLEMQVGQIDKDNAWQGVQPLPHRTRLLRISRFHHDWQAMIRSFAHLN